MSINAPSDVVDAYGACYSAGDAAGIADLCAAPFVAIRNGEVVHLPDRDAVLTHFQTLIDGYRATGAASFRLGSLHIQTLGERSCMAMAIWKVLGADGQLLRDRATTYHLVFGDPGWHFLSYTNHDA